MEESAGGIKRAKPILFHKAVRIKPDGGIEASAYSSGTSARAKRTCSLGLFPLFGNPPSVFDNALQEVSEVLLSLEKARPINRGWHCPAHANLASAMDATRDARARFRVFWAELAVQYYRDYHSHARRTSNDLIDFITKRVKNAIDKSEFNMIGWKFSRNSITKSIGQIRREAENAAVAPGIAGIE